MTAVTGTISDTMLASRRVSEAEKRYRNYVRAQDQAGGGAVVFFDRYPLDALPIDGRVMDGARLETELPERRSGLLRWFTTKERNTYRKIVPPEQVIALAVSPEESQRRKPDHDAAAIAAKTAAIRAAVDAEANVICIDAD